MFKMKLDVQNGAPVLMRLPEIDLIDDGPGKPVGIGKFIGRKPVVALEIQTGISRCWSGPQLHPVRIFSSSFIIRMPSAKLLMIATLRLDGSIKRSTKQSPNIGWLWI